MKTASFKLIFRSWWQNKTFMVISILSLAIGIACTNLLAAFVIYEYNIEAGNPNKDRILYMSQTSPMNPDEQVSYTVGNIPPMLKENYPEVEAYLRLGQKSIQYVAVEQVKHSSLFILEADPSFPLFFPYETIAGNLEDALKEPNKLALMEEVARRLFGSSDPIGRMVQLALPDWAVKPNDENPENDSYEVVAVLKDRSQSFLQFEGLTAISRDFNGGTSFLLTNRPIDKESFAHHVKKDGIPTLQMGNVQTGQERYYFTSLQDSYFQQYSVSETIPYVNRQQKVLLYVGFISSLLVLLIACFNYVNLSFSRLLKQVRMIHIQKLMGAGQGDVRGYFFMDTFLTVFIAFLLSLFIIHDVVPVFNSILGGRLTTGFIFNRQVFPVLCAGVFFLSIIPAIYMGSKVSRLSLTDYRRFFTGNSRRRIVSVLSVAQFAISIALVIATFTVESQLGYIRKGGEGYKGLIEIGEWSLKDEKVRAFVRELKELPGIKEVSRTSGGIIHCMISQIAVKDENGNEINYWLSQHHGETDFFNTFKIELLQGLTPNEAVQTYANPVYINEEFAKIFRVEKENIVGEVLMAYDKSLEDVQGFVGTKPDAVIVGVVRNLFVNSLEQNVFPGVIYINNSEADDLTIVYVRLDKNKGELLQTIRQIWERLNPTKEFTYRDVYQGYLDFNHKTFELAYLLLMYAVISLLLTCFGLYGMALYAAEQRTKEIGIRKVNGATTTQILILLNSRFVKWILIAFCMAAPVVWLLLSRWLESFVYRVDMSFWICLLALLFVLAITLLTVSWRSCRAARKNPVEVLKSE